MSTEIITAVVPAAGLGVRLSLDLAKPFIEIKAKPIIVYTLEVLHAHPFIDEIVVVAHEDSLEVLRGFVKRYALEKVVRVIPGGATRKESVRNGLEVVSSKSRFVLIHDGVRPFVDEGDISRVIDACREGGAAVLGVPVKSTLKRVDRNLDVDETLRRDLIWEIQTPQVFERELIQKAYLAASKHAVPDDAALVEYLGKKIKVVRGSYFNIKITTQEDLVFAEAIIKARAVERI